MTTSSEGCLLFSNGSDDDEDYNDNSADTVVDCDASEQAPSHMELVLTKTLRFNVPLLAKSNGNTGTELGCKLWMASKLLCGLLLRRQLPKQPPPKCLCVSSKDVLEIGAGLGLCGLTAAALGARHATITDCGVETLQQLNLTLTAYGRAVNGEQATASTTISDTSTFSTCGSRSSSDEEDNQTVGFVYDRDDDYSNVIDAVVQKQKSLCTSSAMERTNNVLWNAANVSIRRLLWEEDLEYLSALEEERDMSQVYHWSKTGSHRDLPTLGDEQTFDVILASDVLYFSAQEQPLLAVLKRRLRSSPNSLGLMLQTMRTNNVEVFQRFVEAARLLFQVELCDVTPEELFVEEIAGTPANETPHTTGYKLVTLRHLQESKPFRYYC